MLALLPVVSGILLAVRLYRIGSVRDWRMSLLHAVTITGAAAALLPEILSLFHAFQGLWVTAFWLATAIFLLIANLRMRDPLRRALTIRLEHSLDVPSIILIVCAAVLLILTGTVAVFSATNNWDAMTYHMPRVMQWIQSQSVAFYPTANIRQDYLAPWAEFVITQMQLLAHTDRFANLVEWGSMLCSVIGISVAAKQLGANRFGQAFAATICLTIPMGLLQSTTAQTDYAEAMWCILLSVSIFALRDRVTWAGTLWIGANLGLALLTKATATLYATPFMLYLVVILLQRLRFRALLHYTLIGAATLTLVAGFWLRTIQLLGSPFGQTESDSIYTNASFTPAVLFSNVVKNTALNLGSDNPDHNLQIEATLRAFLQNLGIKPGDPGTRFRSFTFYVPSAPSSEDTNGNLLHVLLTAAAVVLALNRKHLKQPPLSFLHLALVLLGYLLFCLILRWQPWNNRLEFPLFALASAGIGTLLNQFGRLRVNVIVLILIFGTYALYGNDIAIHPLLNTLISIGMGAAVMIGLLGVKPQIAVLLVLSIAAVPIIVYSPRRPLIGQNSLFATSRADQYVLEAPPDYQTALPHVVDQIANGGCRTIGLLTQRDSLEYPLEAFAHLHGLTLHIEHYNVTNPSSRYPNEIDDPCMLIGIDVPVTPDVVVNGHTYRNSWSESMFSTYVP